MAEWGHKSAGCPFHRMDASSSECRARSRMLRDSVRLGSATPLQTRVLRPRHKEPEQDGDDRRCSADCLAQGSPGQDVCPDSLLSFFFSYRAIALAFV